MSLRTYFDAAQKQAGSGVQHMRLASVTKLEGAQAAEQIDKARKAVEKLKAARDQKKKAASR